VYDNYQRVVHNDKPGERSRASFKRFLCKSPLKREMKTMPDGRQRLLGSYHQCYRLDGKLVAIGVLDLLPNCVSSVYFLYDESLHKFSPGKLSALFEIALAKEEGYGYWYPGFYIHSCPKMRYKLDYSPQEILDPVALHWDPLDKEILGLLDQTPFVSLSLHRKSQQEHTATIEASNARAPSPHDTSNGEKFGGESVFQVNMPGVTSIDEMERVDLDYIPLLLPGAPPSLFTSDLISWEDTTIRSWPSIKASVAELVAALGPEAVRSICLVLGKHGSD
jgi:arginine-tRNA-protein transferase